MLHQGLKKHIYEYALSLLAKELDISPLELLSKVDGKTEFMGTEIILMSKLMNINNPEQIFLQQ